MNYECKHCGDQFTQAWGPARCPKCGSKDIWTTGGEVTSIVILLVVALALLAVLYALSPLLFLGGAIGFLVVFPVAVWSILARRKKSGSDNDRWEQERWVERIRREMEKKDTEELRQILEEGNREEWSEEAFEAIEAVLRARGESVERP